MLTSAADLVYIMNWDLETEPKKSVQAKLFVELDEVEKSIYTYLQRDGKQLLDTIALECQVPVFKGLINPIKYGNERSDKAFTRETI